MTEPNSIPKMNDTITVANRPPRATDDITTLYRVGDLWQHSGECLTCIRNDAGQAVWQSALDEPVTLPGDQFSTSLAAAYGTSRLVSHYTGALVDVVAVNGNASTIITIGQNKNGLASQEDIRNALVFSAPNNPLYVVRMYDQSGNNHHASTPGYDGITPNINIANCPHLAVRKHGQYDLISWAAEPAPSQPLRIPSTLSLSGASASVLFYGAVSSCNCPQYTTYSLLGLGTTDGEALTLTIGAGAETGRVAVSNYDAASILETSDVSLNTEHGMRVVTLEGNDSLTVHAPFDGISAQKITGLSGLSERQFSGGVVGASPKGGGNSCAMQISNLLLLNTAASDANLKQAYKNAATLYDYKPQTRTRIDCFGSSTTQGYLNKDGLCWPQMLHDYLWTPTEVRSISVAGSTASDFLQHTIENMLKDTKTQLRRKIAITWYGNNDINRGHPITLIVENNAKIHRQLRAAGYERLFILGQYNRNLNVSLQQAVIDGTIDADAFIDPWSIPPMMTHSDKELYHDGTHPTAIGDQIIANIIAQTLKNYL